MKNKLSFLLKSKMRSLGMTQTMLCLKSGVSYPTILKMLSDDFICISLQSVIYVCEALKLTPEEEEECALAYYEECKKDLFCWKGGEIDES